MAHSVAVSLSPSCVELLLPGGAGREKGLNGRLVAAVAYFLTEEGSEEAGHPYPDFRREDGEEHGREFELVIGVDLWRRFAAEADRQQVSPDRLLEHAAFYFLAQADAGIVAERIAEDLGDGP